MELSERIDAIVKYSGLSIPKYAQAIGTKTPQAIRDLIAGNTRSLTKDMQAKILSYMPNLNPVWLLAGEGEMLKQSASLIPQENEVPDRFVSYLVPMAAMGGSLIGFDEEGVNKNQCEKVISPIADIDWVVPVCGDSMEPEYPNGSRVYVREINPCDFIPWGNVFVLDTTNGLIIKMVMESEKEGYIKCVSLNPSGRYTPFDVPMHAIRAMYRVIVCLSIK